MRLVYITNSRIPTEKAHGWAISKMCEQFADLGIDVLLVLPKRKNVIREDIFDYYEIKRNFKVKKIFNIDFIGCFQFCHKLFFLIQRISFLLSSLFIPAQKDDFIYIRNIEHLLFWSLKNKNIFFEIHFLSKIDKLLLFLIKRAKKIIVITRTLRESLIKYGLAAEKILVVPDGVDIEQFKVQSPKFKIREKLDLPQDKKIVLYTGHLYQWKGVYTLLEASQYLPEDVLIVFVGGTEYDLKSFKLQAPNTKNILIVGHRPFKEIPYWLKAADVLVLPNSAKQEISKYWTSPIKMFEYMTSQRPIVASDLPSLREILDENNALLVEPDNPRAIASGIEQALKNSDFSAKIARQAFEDVQHYTWENRARKILEFIKNG